MLNESIAKYLKELTAEKRNRLFAMDDKISKKTGVSLATTEKGKWYIGQVK